MTSDQRGVLWALASVAVITAMGPVIKHLAQLGVGVFIVTFFQSAVIWAFAFPALARHGRAAFATRRPALHVLRAALSVVSFACMTYALGALTLADAVALSFSIPLWSIPLSVLFLGEGVRLRRWLATGFGFVGILCIVRPGVHFEWGMVIALAGAVLGSGTKIATKKLTVTDGIPQIIFYYSSIATLIAAPFAAWSWQPLDGEQWAWLLLSGLLGYLGHQCMVRAFAAADMTIVSPMDFIRMPLSAVLGIFLFDETPDTWTVIGIAIIGAASLYIARREAALQRGGRVADPSSPCPSGRAARP